MTASKDTFLGRWIVLGLLIWLVLTLGFRLFGQYLLVPGDTLRTVLLFGATVPLLFGLMAWVFGRERVESADRGLVATVILGPGLMLDGLLIANFGHTMPNMASEAAGLYGALMCWGYGACLVASFWPRR